MDRIKNFIKKGNLGSSEESKTRKRVDEYERTRKGIQQKLSADTAKLGLENQGLSKEITARTDYRKRVVLPCLVLEKTRLARLDALRAAQKEAIALLKAILDKEEALLRTEETNKVKQSQAVEEREELETTWIVQSLNVDSNQKHLENELNKITNVKHQISSLSSQFAQVRVQAVEKAVMWQTKREKFEQSTQPLLQNVQLIADLLSKERQKTQFKMLKIQKQNEWKDLMHRMEAACEDTQIDREIPEWDNNQYPWHFDLSVKAESYSLVSDQPIRPSTILQHLRPVTQELHLKVMELPHAKGTFRRAYYAKDKITGKRYVLKQFHIQRGKEADYKDCQRVAKMYAFTRYCAALFENELFIAQQRRFAEMGGTRYHLTNHYFDIHSLTYVNCYYAHVKPIFQFDDSLEDTAVMIEPLLPSFQKWINNDIEDRFADARDTNPHVEALSTFIHWTYERSERAFIISDLQGVKFMLPLNVTSNDIDTVMANQLPFTDTDFSYGERVIKWILSDPAVHFLKEPSSSSSTTAKDSDASSVRSSSRKNDKFANELKDALQVDFDGNLGLQAETLLFERHICGPMCNVLGLSTLIR